MTSKKSTGASASKAAAKAGAKGTKAASAPAARRRTTSRKSAIKKSTEAKHVAIEDLPTEEIWIHYSKAREAKNVQDIEAIRNILMERHFPLVK